MKEHNEQPLETLVEVAADPDVQRRLKAVWALGQRGRGGDIRGIPVLLRLMSEVGTYVDEAASDALRQIGEPAVEPLLALLGDRGADGHARGWAARTLAHVGDKRAVEPMVAILSDRTEGSTVRRMTAFYLGWLGDARTADPLIRTMMGRDDDREVRINAAHSLGVLRDGRAIEPLVEMLRDEAIANVAAHSLEELHDARAIEVLLPTFASDDESWRLHVSAIVGKAGEAALGPLLQALESDDWRVRSAAARALGFAADRRALARLIVALGDENEAVREEAATALAFIEDDQVVDPLVGLLHDQSVRVRLAGAQSLFHRALTGHRDQRILPILRRVVEHDEGTIQGDRIVAYAVERAIRELNHGEGHA